MNEIQHTVEPSDDHLIEELKQLEPADVWARFRAGTISRRDLTKFLGAIGLAAMGGKLLGGEALAQTQLNAIVWEGYTAEAFAKTWEDANDAKTIPPSWRRPMMPSPSFRRAAAATSIS